MGIWEKLFRKKTTEFDSISVALSNLKEIKSAGDKGFKMIKRDPQNPKGYYEIARNLNYKKNYDEAIENLHKAISLDSKFEAAWQLRAEIYREQQDYNKAAINAQEVIRINPNNYNATYLLGLAFYKMNMLRESLECFEKCEELDPTIQNHRYLIDKIKELMLHDGIKPLDLYSYHDVFSKGDLIRIKEALKSAPTLTEEKRLKLFPPEKYETPIVGSLDKIMSWLGETLMANSKLGSISLSAVWVNFEYVNIIRNINYFDQTKEISHNILLVNNGNNKYCAFIHSAYS